MSDEGEPSLQLVADGVHAWIQPDGTWWLNNAGAVVTDAGVLVVDTCATERRTRAFLTAVQQISGDARVYGFGRGSRAGARLDRDFRPEYVVPGHGPLINSAELTGVLETHRRYYDLVLHTAQTRSSRRTPAAGRHPTLRTRHLRRAARLGADCAQLHRAYADDLGIEMNVIGALTDAVALNNGPMRTSV